MLRSISCQHVYVMITISCPNVFLYQFGPAQGGRVSGVPTPAHVMILVCREAEYPQCIFGSGVQTVSRWISGASMHQTRVRKLPRPACCVRVEGALIKQMISSDFICIVQRVPAPGLTMHAWSHTNTAIGNTYLSMPYHECMGTIGHGHTPPTGGLPCVQGSMCSHAHLTHRRAHAHAVVPGGPMCCTCNPGQHGTGWPWTGVSCLGRAHADMAQPVPGPVGRKQICTCYNLDVCMPK